VLDRIYEIKTTGLNNFIIFENCNHNLLNDIIITSSVTLPIRQSEFGVIEEGVLRGMAERLPLWKKWMYALGQLGWSLSLIHI